MLGLLSVIINVSSYCLALLPSFLILHFCCFKSLKKTALYFIFSVYLAGVFVVVGLPSVKNLTIDPGINFIPFIEMISDIKNALLNVVLFIPLGLFLPLIWEKFRRFKSAFLFGFGLSAVIEILQIFTFRLTDINDLITNSAGTAIGFFIAKRAVKKFNAFSSESPAAAVGLCVFVYAVGFLIVPFISSAIWNIYYKN